MVIIVRGDSLIYVFWNANVFDEKFETSKMRVDALGCFHGNPKFIIMR